MLFFCGDTSVSLIEEIFMAAQGTLQNWSFIIRLASIVRLT